jgi:hypothetical protein
MRALFLENQGGKAISNACQKRDIEEQVEKVWKTSKE